MRRVWGRVFIHGCTLARIMLDYLLAIDLLLLTAAVLTLVWKCFTTTSNAHTFGGYLTERIELLSGNLTEVGAILEDIASALEEEPGGAPPALAGTVPEILGNLLMSRMTMAGDNAETIQADRALHEGELIASPE